MSRIFLASTLATLLCASLAAQATQAPPPQPTQRVAPPSAGGDPAPAADPQSQTRSATSAKADTVTVEGCIQKGAASSAATGTTGTTGSSANAFMLVSAMKPATSKETAPVASSYRLDAADSKLSPHVGHKVEISGTVDQASASGSPSGAGSPSSAAPTLKVDNVKMIAATCTP